jgi:hypothetical protein
MALFEHIRGHKQEVISASLILTKHMAGKERINRKRYIQAAPYAIAQGEPASKDLLVFKELHAC